MDVSSHAKAGSLEWGGVKGGEHQLEGATMIKPETIQRYLPSVREQLEKLARRRELVSYRELGVPRNVIGHTLAAIAEEEHAAGRPILSAIAVQKGSKRPGKGFWMLPMIVDPGAESQRTKAWVAERDRVWDFWSNR